MIVGARLKQGPEPITRNDVEAVIGQPSKEWEPPDPHNVRLGHKDAWVGEWHASGGIRFAIGVGPNYVAMSSVSPVNTGSPRRAEFMYEALGLLERRLGVEFERIDHTKWAGFAWEQDEVPA